MDNSMRMAFTEYFFLIAIVVFGKNFTEVWF